MADAAPPDTAAQGSTLERGADKLNSVVSGLNNSIEKLSGMLGSLSTGAGASANASAISIENLQKLIAAAKGSTKDLAEAINRQFSAVSSSPATKQFNTFSSSAVGSFASVGKAASSMMSFIEKNAGKMGEVLGSAGIIGSARFQKAIVEKLGDATGYNMAQKHLMEIQQQALQVGVAFDGALGDAQSNFNFLNRSLRESSLLTKSMPSVVLEVQKALGETFGGTGIIQNLGNLARAQDNIKASLTATNAALLINKATGMEIPTITNMMTVAHTQLGESIEGSVLAFGRIKESSDKSGIGFKNTADSIMRATNSLKMWGGTIGAVSPLFDMFSKSLRGTGREGLTPELLEKMTSGLAGMTTSTKALLGIQAGMGGGGGAIGGALEIEEAMEKGPEGMKKVVDSLTQTLTQFGGGKILTRAEAIKDPTAQANFLLQRQLLGKLIGVDEATSTKMLDALSGVEQTGLQTGSNAEEELGKLLGSGEQIADATTTTMDKLSIQEINAINAGSKGIIEAVQGLADNLDIGAFTQGIDAALQQAIIAGQVNPEDIARHLSRATRDRDTAKERVQEARATGRQPSQRQISELNRAQQSVEQARASQQMQALLPKMVSDAMSQGQLTNEETITVGTTGQVPSRMIDEAMGNITRQNAELINDLGAKISQGKASPEEVRMFNLMSATMESLRNAVSDGVQIQPGNLNIKTDTSSLERTIDGLDAGREIPAIPELPPLPSIQALQPMGSATRSETPAASPTAIQRVELAQPPAPVLASRAEALPLPVVQPSANRNERIPEMVRREFPRTQPIMAPPTDINATRLRTEVANRQAATPAPNIMEELNVQTLNADKLTIPLAFEKLTQSIDDLSRQPMTRELVNSTVPERPVPPVPAAITAANTARREAAAGTAVAVPVQQVRQTREEKEVVIKVTMEGDSTIRLQPIIRKVVSDMHRENPEN